MSLFHTVSSPDSPLEVALESTTGLPTALMLPRSTISRSIRVSISADIGGTESRGWTGGVRYDGTTTVDELRVNDSTWRRNHRGRCDEYTVEARLGDLALQLSYRLFPTSPFLEFVAVISADQEVLVRNLRAVIEVLGEPAQQGLHTPGNAIHRGLTVEELGEQPYGISQIGGLRGASGLVSVADEGSVLTVWPNQDSEIPDVVLTRQPSGLRVHIETNFAGAVGPRSSAELILATLDLQPGDFERVREQWPDWASRYALTTPPVKPDWVPSSSIYEVQIGTSHFWGGNAYCRYPEIADLTADIERVQSLGFSVIQLMPRQPYPSYNVHDYADITTSYGDESQLKDLVRIAHDRGMRVILDVLLHGVLDNESVDMALEGIAAGPLASRLEEETGDSFTSDLSDDTNYFIAWSRHIHDFAEHWKGGSPLRSPLIDEHPEWFFRNSDGAVTGVYTKAFDARNPDWQEYFRAAMLHLVLTLDVDGFRFDAPTYNNFPNWAEWSRARAGLSPLGCVPLFVDLRRELKELKPEALMYTEPSGHLLRRSMDLNYNYDEQWLVTAVSSSDGSPERGVRTARQFMQWIEDRDHFLPVGGQTAHHIDSHDTFWWPQWGKKWRREQFGVDKVRALVCTFLALDGPYMMFTGGEEGIEQELRLLNGLRRSRPDLWATPLSFDTASDASGELFIARRTSDHDQLLVVVNLTGDGPAVLPDVLRTETWHVLGSRGYAAGELERHGYLVALRADD
jgi:glycosidase